MTLETVTYANSLNAAYPAEDEVNTLHEGNDHIRNIKRAIVSTFPNLSGAVTASHTELNYVDGVTSAIQTQLDAKVVAAGGTMSGDLTMANNDIVQAKTIGYYAEYDNGNSGSADTITLANGQKQKSTLTADTTLTLSTTGAPVGHYQLKLIQDATGGRTVTFSGIGSTAWLNSSTVPDINGAANGVTFVNMYWDGTTIYASMSKVGAA